MKLEDYLTMNERNCWIIDLSRYYAPRLQRLVRAASIGLLVGALSGCSTAVNPDPTSGSPSTAAVGPIVTGNWQFNLTPSSGNALFPYLSGYLREDAAGNYVDAELTETSSSGCFDGTIPISADGTAAGTALTLNSFSINGQFLAMTGTMNGTGSSMTGNYTVSGGCASGNSGTFTGTLYSQLTGTYVGAIANSNPAATISLNLQQSSAGNGNGVILVAGTATFSGMSSCFTSSGTVLAPSGYITGSMTQLSFTDTNGNQIQLNGTIDVAADTLTLSSITMLSGSCAGKSYDAVLKSAGA